ncbi:hypothetical protein [Agarivorans aestuarii]|uniref:hypothetical protein n=1 Tax=Agarivorans aestuarii TaxID=1563703 RepID=UPI001C81FB61|nr:hypothetical protein [Agarivorans aestuarii]
MISLVEVLNSIVAVGLPITFLTFSISLLLFGRISLKHFDKQIKKVHGDIPEWDKGFGTRLPMYALTVVSKRVGNIQLYDEKLVQRSIRTIDKVLAVIFLTSSVAMLFIGLTHYLMFG